MSNTSYLKFESTYRDLMDCLAALEDQGGIHGVEENAQEYEKPYVRLLIETCREIVDEYGDELNS